MASSSSSVETEATILADVKEVALVIAKQKRRLKNARKPGKTSRLQNVDVAGILRNAENDRAVLLAKLAKTRKLKAIVDVDTMIARDELQNACHASFLAPPVQVTSPVFFDARDEEPADGQAGLALTGEQTCAPLNVPLVLYPHYSLGCASTGSLSPSADDPHSSLSGDFVAVQSGHGPTSTITATGSTSVGTMAGEGLNVGSCPRVGTPPFILDSGSSVAPPLYGSVGGPGYRRSF